MCDPVRLYAVLRGSTYIHKCVSIYRFAEHNMYCRITKHHFCIFPKHSLIQWDKCAWIDT